MILTRSSRLSQPTGPVEVDWQNVYANGIEFAYIPGFSRDLTRKAGAIQAVGAGTTFVGGTMVTPGTDRNNGLILATGALLGPMQESTVLSIANTSAGIIAAGGFTADGLIGTGGNALYSERAPTGNDIYKLGLVATGGPTLNAEFVYRNDGGNILQQRVNIGSESADGRTLAIAAVKSGTAHSVYGNAVRSVGTFGSASSAFTNASIQRRIGSDVADGTCAWNGQILLVAGWSRALSADDIAGLRDNPWQLFRPVQRRVYFDMGAGGGATTSVNADLGADYTIRSTVQSDGSGAYAIRAEVAADASSGYGIRGVVSADAAVSYVVRAPALADLPSAFTVRGFAQADAASTFTVRGGAASDATAAYLLRGAASSDLSASYDIQTASGVSSSVSASYVVRGAVQSDASAAYDLRTAVGANSEHAFMVRGLVSSDLDASFTVDASSVPVYADMQAAYLVDGGAVFIPSQFVASVPAGVFSARAPAGEYSATVPAGNYRASI